MSNQSQFRHILVIEDEKSRRIVTLEENIYPIGRDSNNAIIIYDRLVSRYHATLLQNKDENNHDLGYKIIDGDLKGNISTNGLVINGKPSLSHDLKHGDLIKFGGKSRALYYIVSDPADLSLFKQGENPEQIFRAKSILNTDELKTTLKSSKDLDRLSQEELVRLASFPELSPNPIIEIDWAGTITYLNPSASIKFKDIYQAKLKHPIIAGLTVNCQNKNGSLFVREVKIGAEIFEQYVHYLSDSNLIRSYIFDFTKRKQTEAALRESEELYRTIIRQSSEGVFLVEAKTNKILEANNAYCTLLGYNQSEILGLTLNDVAIAGEIIAQDIQWQLTDKLDLQGEAQHRKKDGSLINVKVNVSRIVSSGKEILCFSVKDINNLLNTETKLNTQGFYDPLTGLYNPMIFKEQLTAILANAQNNENIVAVMFLDIEQLDNIKNEQGDIIASQVVQTFAERLKFYLRSNDILARWSENEFAVLVTQILAVKDIAKLAQRLIENLVQPIEIEKKSEKKTVKKLIEFTTNIGIAVYPQHGENSENLLKNVVMAWQRSKYHKNNTYQFYSPTMTSKTTRLLRLEALLYQALEKEEFLLEYQPIVNIKTGKISGMEALLRWQHPELERVPPGKLISLAEETDLIFSISEWVIKTACQQNKAWQNAGLPYLPISVNLSTRQFQDPLLLTRVSRVIQETGLKAHFLELEITEKTIMEDIELSRKSVRELLQAGIHLSIDDFGTGYCSLSHLKKFPFHTLKIDQSFVRELRNDPLDTGIISAIIALGRSFNMRVVAEGVERVEQLEILRSLNCEEMQGYFFSQPLNLEDATDFLRLGYFRRS